MPTQDHTPAGAPCWIDHHAPAPAAAADLYAGLLGSDVEGPSEEHGGYRNLLLHGRRITGAMGTPPEVLRTPEGGPYGPERAGRALAAMMSMSKLDIGAMRGAADGTA